MLAPNTYTKKDVKYIKEQFQIIQDKALRKYACSLHTAPTPPHIKETLTRAVEVRMKELTMEFPEVVNGDLDDFN